MNDYHISFDDAEMISPTNETAYKMNTGNQHYHHLYQNYDSKMEGMFNTQGDSEFGKGNPLDNNNIKIL